VEFDKRLYDDVIVIGGKEAEGSARDRVVAHLDRVRKQARIETKARIQSENNFPTGVGIASSASAFAALSVAATQAAGLELTERELSILARQAAGSASRSIPSGFVEWVAGYHSADSYAISIAPPEHWDLRDVVAIVSIEEKKVGSYEGHAAAQTSPFLSTRISALPSRFHLVRRAILSKELSLLGAAIEEDAIELHMMAMTSRPPIYYWTPGMVRVIQSVQQWRADGLAVYYTLDAGPNVHLICESKDVDQVATLARDVRDVQQVIVNGPGESAHLIDQHLF
jgi:diphosphomevalonate decarboxylase